MDQALHRLLSLALLLPVLLISLGADSKDAEDPYQPHTPTLIFYVTGLHDKADTDAIAASVAKLKSAKVVEVNIARSFVRLRFDSHVVSYHQAAQALADAGEIAIEILRSLARLHRSQLRQARKRRKGGRDLCGQAIEQPRACDAHRQGGRQIRRPLSRIKSRRQRSRAAGVQWRTPPSPHLRPPAARWSSASRKDHASSDATTQPSTKQ